MNRPDIDNHFVLCPDGKIFNLLDVLTYDESINKTIDNIVKQHGEIIKAFPTPLKLFDEIIGLAKDGRGFLKIGETNWSNLWMIRGEFEYYCAYILLNGERKLVATSTEGFFWNFNIIDA